MAGEGERGRLVRLKLLLDGDAGEFHRNQASLFQGVLMEQIDPEYAQYLHEQGMKPYSQYLELKDRPVWNICSLSEEAYERMIVPCMRDSFSRICLKRRDEDRVISIIGRETEELQLDTLFRNFYSQDAPAVFRLEFNSPTAFKKDGRYHFFPEMYNIYQSLMKRFDEVTDRGNMFSQDTLEQLTDATEICGYSLRSVHFSMEGIRIPAFMGSITIKLHGGQTMRNFARMLFEFGQYSGVGIKTAIGMGSMQFEEKGRRSV